MTPTSVTFGKSSPLAIICVPSRIFTSPRAKALERRLVAAGPLHRVAVHPHARDVAGKRLLISASSRSVPKP